MKKRIIKTGLIGSLVLVGIPFISLLFTGTGPESMGIAEVIGYTSIVVAMGLIFFAIKSYRDEENGGILSFGEGMKMGAAIAAIGGLAFAIYNAVYVLWIAPGFTEDYFAYTTGLEKGSPELAQQILELKETYGWWMTTEGQSFTMFMTVFLIGIVITVISSLVLQSKGERQVSMA